MRTAIIDEMRIPADVPAGSPRRHEPDVATHGVKTNDITPNDIARRLTGRDYISYSAVSTYQRCPLKYFFQYVADLPFEHVASSLIFGGAIHTAIEIHFRALLAGETPPGLPDLLKVYDLAWKNDATGPVQFAKGESDESLRDQAERMLMAFQASPESRVNGTILGVEEEFRAQVVPRCPDLVGRVDLLVLDEGGLRVIDFKTSRSRWNDGKIAEYAPQMLLYSELIRPVAEASADAPVQIEWIVVTKAQSPTVETHTAHPEPHQVGRTKAVVKLVWDSIQAGCFYPSPSPMNCGSCPYTSTCRQWEG